jgi:hypothetical protein
MSADRNQLAGINADVRVCYTGNCDSPGSYFIQLYNMGVILSVII